VSSSNGQLPGTIIAAPGWSGVLQAARAAFLAVCCRLLVVPLRMRSLDPLERNRPRTPSNKSQVRAAGGHFRTSYPRRFGPQFRPLFVSDFNSGVQHCRLPDPKSSATRHRYGTKICSRPDSNEARCPGGGRAHAAALLSNNRDAEAEQAAEPARAHPPPAHGEPTPPACQPPPPPTQQRHPMPNPKQGRN